MKTHIVSIIPSRAPEDGWLFTDTIEWSADTIVARLINNGYVEDSASAYSSADGKCNYRFLTSSDGYVTKVLREEVSA